MTVKLTTEDVLEAFIEHGAWRAVPTRGRAASIEMFEAWKETLEDRAYWAGHAAGYQDRREDEWNDPR